MLIDRIAGFTTQKILILGLGAENTQFMEWAVKVIGLNPRIFVLADYQDIKMDQLDTVKFFQKGDGFARDQVYFGENYMQALNRADIEYIIKAPGIWSLTPELVKFRKQKGADRVISPLHFFFEKFREQIIGVTGTKGKTTTSGFLAHCINVLDGMDAVFCGNSTNITPYKFWDALDVELDPARFFIIELSSFQLQDLGFSKLSPERAIITNYFVDHLDQHTDKEEYWAAKNNIYLYQKDLCLVTSDLVPPEVQAQATYVLSNDDVRLCTNSLSIPLIGEHNHSNITEALQMIALIKNTSLASLIKNNHQQIQGALDSFKNLPFRLELADEIRKTISIDGQQKELLIRFVNDGAATEPEAVIAALNATTQKPNEFLWIQFAGKDKGAEVEGIINTLLRIQKSNRLFRVNYCGEIGCKILSETYRKMKVPITADKESLRDVVKQEFNSRIHIDFAKWVEELITNLNSIGAGNQAMELITSDTLVLTVLLSPCGSSFDEFDNYIQRSEFWNDAVSAIYS